MNGETRKVVFCLPTLTRPHQATLDSIRASVPALDAAGWTHAMVNEIGCPYISAARATMLRKALDAKATDVMFIDHDVSWRPQDLMKLLATEGDVVAGTYRFKMEEERYMGAVYSTINGTPLTRKKDGAVKASAAPAGFLHITRAAVNRFVEAYPALCYGERCNPHVDLFNHGAHNFSWYGEDYAFSRNWIDAGGEIWIVPDMNIDHHSADSTFKGNFHHFLCQQPGGSEDTSLDV